MIGGTPDSFPASRIVLATRGCDSSEFSSKMAEERKELDWDLNINVPEKGVHRKIRVTSNESVAVVMMKVANKLGACKRRGWLWRKGYSRPRDLCVRCIAISIIFFLWGRYKNYYYTAPLKMAGDLW